MDLSKSQKTDINYAFYNMTSNVRNKELTSFV